MLDLMVLLDLRNKLMCQGIRPTDWNRGKANHRAFRVEIQRNARFQSLLLIRSGKNLFRNLDEMLIKIL